MNDERQGAEYHTGLRAQFFTVSRKIVSIYAPICCFSVSHDWLDHCTLYNHREKTDLKEKTSKTDARLAIKTNISAKDVHQIQSKIQKKTQSLFRHTAESCEYAAWISLRKDEF